MPTGITQEYVKSILHYNSKTGAFMWIIRKSSRVNAGDIAGCINNRGYMQVKIDHRAWLLHRIAFAYMTGSTPKQVDHINHNKTDNRWVNLRSADHKENSINRTLSSNNKSGFYGVYQVGKKWTAGIGVDGKSVHLGTFDSKSTAIAARKTAEIKYGFHKNHGSVALHALA